MLVAVETGESFTIASHGRPVAVLSQAESPARAFGRFAGLIAIGDDFDAPLTEDELAEWGEIR